MPAGFVPGSYTSVAPVAPAVAPAGRYASEGYRHSPAGYTQDDDERRRADDGQKSAVRRHYFVEFPNARQWDQYLGQSLSYENRMRGQNNASYAAMVATSVFLTILARIIEWFRRQLDIMIRAVERQ
jgi:hypothetical protein